MYGCDDWVILLFSFALCCIPVFIGIYFDVKYVAIITGILITIILLYFVVIPEPNRKECYAMAFQYNGTINMELKHNLILKSYDNLSNNSNMFFLLYIPFLAFLGNLIHKGIHKYGDFSNTRIYFMNGKKVKSFFWSCIVFSFSSFIASLMATYNINYIVIDFLNQGIFLSIQCMQKYLSLQFFCFLWGTIFLFILVFIKE